MNSHICHVHRGRLINNFTGKTVKEPAIIVDILRDKFLGFGTIAEMDAEFEKKYRHVTEIDMREKRENMIRVLPIRTDLTEEAQCYIIRKMQERQGSGFIRAFAYGQGRQIFWDCLAHDIQYGTDTVMENMTM